MRLITIVKQHEGMIAIDEAAIGARREWTVTGCLDIYLKGAFSPMEYAQAANLAMNITLGMNIPAVSLKRVMGQSSKKQVKRHEKSQRLL